MTTTTMMISGGAGTHVTMSPRNVMTPAMPMTPVIRVAIMLHVLSWSAERPWRSLSRPERGGFPCREF
jgi:hypothetical protein